MSMVEDGRSLAGYTLDDVLANNKRPGAPGTARAADIRNRTLLDIIRDEEPSAGKGLFGHKDKRTWKSFRDKLRLKRAGSAWVSTVPIPTSDMPVHNKRSLIGKRNQVRFNTLSSKTSGESSRNPSQIDESSKSYRPQTSRQSSTLYSSSDSTTFQHDDSCEYSSSPDAAPVRIMRPQMSRHNSVRISNPVENYTDPTEPERDNRVRQITTTLSGERMMSAREAVAAQEAADAAAAAAAADEEEEEEEKEENDDSEDDENENEESTTGSESSATSHPVRMSLMDLLVETDREMGLEGSSYGMGEEEEYYDYDDDDEDDEDYDDDEDGRGGGDFSCCVCMVRHRSAPFGACGHTFCRLCSKELMVSRGNCPTCNDFILEIVHAF